MFETIQKRNGSLVPFDPNKIIAAIQKAGFATGEFGEEIARKLARQVLNLIQWTLVDPVPTVEEVQDIVEEVLLASPYLLTAKAYILYREQHARLREIVAQTEVDLVDQYLRQANWRVNENSNMAFSLQGLNNFICSTISETYWLNKIYSPEIRAAHINGDFHLHDLNLLSVYCVGWDLMDLLTEGFRGVKGKIESTPPRHFRSALGQVVNFFYTLQGESAGAQAFSNFDTLLAPFIRYDRLTDQQIQQALQEFIFNVNVPTRVGFQTPFTNITLDLTVPAHLADHPVIIGGQPQAEPYSDFQPEIDRFNRILMEVMLAGDASGRVFTFPIPTINITPDFAWDNPNLAPLWKLTAKYGVPYFSNFVNSDLKPEDARSMCCRLRLDTRKLELRGGGLFGSNPLTGSIGVVTINLPRLGYLAQDKADFFRRLERLLILAQHSLETKRKVLERFCADGLYPYTQFYLRHVYQRFGEYWANHFSTIGLIGMHEACLNLVDAGIETPEGRQLALETLDFMQMKLLQFQAETRHYYNLEATPAEGTSYRLARQDQEAYPDLQLACTTGNVPFYTNSTQLPVSFSDDPFAILDHQDDLQTRYTGGTVIHLFAGERIDQPEVVKKLVRVVCHQYRLPYFTLTPTFSICSQHGYLTGEQPTCPDCDETTEVFSRVVGYLRPISQWNTGKQAEFRQRRTVRVQPESSS